MIKPVKIVPLIIAIMLASGCMQTDTLKDIKATGCKIKEVTVKKELLQFSCHAFNFSLYTKERE